MKKLLTLAAFFVHFTLSAQTADDFSTYQEYHGKYSYGMNPGYYGANWNTQQIIDLGFGKQTEGIRGLGSKSFRMKLSDDFLTRYGFNFLIPDYEYLKSIGAGEITAFIGDPSPEDRLDSSFFYYLNGSDTVRPQAKVWKGMFEPIWKDGKANPANTFASYLEKTVTTYGQYVTFWEIINEPDFTYGSGGWLADADPTNRTTWFYRDPGAEDLYNLHAPLKYYIRALEISWEIIKHYDPTAYVCTGGIGNRSFLAALLRYDAGKWFDVLSFHTYPEFSTLVKYWKACTPAEKQNGCVDGVRYERHSDKLVEGHLLIKQWMDSLLQLAGYDGVNKPKKHFICTETGTSRYPGNDGISGNEIQKNYMIKAHVKMQMDGQIRQTYWFTTGDGANAQHWDQFGCYYWFGSNKPWTVTTADQGIAQKTTSDLLFGATYDAQRTAQLKLPSIVDGGAFRKINGTYVYVLWAKTYVDLSENATATISLPACIRKEWNYSQTGATTSVSELVELNSTPSFFEPVISLPINDQPQPRPGPNRKRYNVKLFNHVYQYLGEKHMVEIEQLKRSLKPGIYILYYDGKHELINKL